MSARRVERPTQINSPTARGWKRRQKRGVASGSLRVAAARNARTRELRFRRQTTAVAAAEGRDGGGSIQGNSIRCHGEVCVRCAKRGKRRLRSFQRSIIFHSARPTSSQRRGMEEGVSELYYRTTVAAGRWSKSKTVRARLRINKIRCKIMNNNQ